MVMFQVAILCACTVGRQMSHMNERFFHLGVVVPGEALETMVELFLWPSIVLVHKLAIYCDYI
jgi:hypothetical protein